MYLNFKIFLPTYNYKDKLNLKVNLIFHNVYHRFTFNIFVAALKLKIVINLTYSN